MATQIKEGQMETTQTKEETMEQTGVNKALPEPIRLMQYAYVANIPAILWGIPGGGKTAAIGAFGRTNVIHVRDFVISHYDPTEINGALVPDFEAMVVRNMPPEYAIELKKNEGSVLFFDELTTASPAQQKVGLKVIGEGKIGGFVVSPTIRRFAAANPPECAVDGLPLEPPMANRFLHIDWDIPESFGIRGLITGRYPEYTLPELPEDAIRRMEADMRAAAGGYLTRTPGRLHSMPESEEQACKAWPSPRTWEYAVRLAAVVKVAGDDDGILYLAFAGCVGEAIAGEVLEYIQNLDLPDPEEILANPSSLGKLRDDKMIVLLGKVAQLATEPDTDEDRYERCWAVFARAAELGMADVAGAHTRTLIEVKDKRGFTLPVKHLKAFLPMLKAAGVL